MVSNSSCKCIIKILPRKDGGVAWELSSLSRILNELEASLTTGRLIGTTGRKVRTEEPSHHYFCTTEIGLPVFPQSLIPLVKMLHLMKGFDWLEEIKIG
jgi:hypothetical protein